MIGKSFLLLLLLPIYLYADYYSDLEKKCQKGLGYECCMLSIKEMKKHGWKEADGIKCPDGYRTDGFRCPGSLAWCHKKEPNYYDRLEKACKGDSCCESSARRMRANDWKEAKDGKCPEGYSRGMLKCESTYKWCFRNVNENEIVPKTSKLQGKKKTKK